VLVLLVEVIYDVHSRDGLRWDDAHTKSHEDLFRHSSNIKGITSVIQVVVVFVLLMRGICDVRH
jgi:hypothetical protein